MGAEFLRIQNKYRYICELLYHISVISVRYLQLQEEVLYNAYYIVSDFGRILHTLGCPV
jgi:hypothetical protein